MNLLELKDLNRHFGTVKAVDAVSLTVQRGQFITLLGPSGCGKTTTLRLIAGFEKPDSGTIHIGGQMVVGQGVYRPPEQRRIGMVFQDYALFPHLNVADNIGFGLKGSRAEKQARVEAMLELVALPHLADRMPHALSGGQQQRVALARALAPQPDLLLLDEPFSNLDAALRAQVRAEVRTILRNAGTTAIFVTHDQEEALSLSDKIAVMFEGKVRQFDTPQQIYNRPASRSVARFIGEANFVPAEANGAKATCVLGEVTLLTPMQGKVDVLIRPERIHLEPTQGGVPAQVLWSEYYGHHQRLGARLDDGTELVIHTDAQVTYTPGQRVGVRVYVPLLGYKAQ